MNHLRRWLHKRILDVVNGLCWVNGKLLTLACRVYPEIFNE